MQQLQRCFSHRQCVWQRTCVAKAAAGVVASRCRVWTALQVFVPEVKEVTQPESEFTIHDYFWGRLGFLFVTLVFGWPAYLVSNVTGRPYSRWANHFDPYSPIFSKRERVEVHLLLLRSCTAHSSSNRLLQPEFCIKLQELAPAPLEALALQQCSRSRQMGHT